MLVKAPFHHQTRDIIAAAIEVHRVLGPGLLESAYSKCFQHELSARQLAFVAQRRVPLVYKGVSLDCDYRLDLLVEGVVVEVKALDTLGPIHQAQLLTYLRLAELPVGLVINFNVDQLVKGIRRVINPRAREMEAEALHADNRTAWSSVRLRFFVSPVRPLSPSPSAISRHQWR
jgi:GxxExxY protein